MTSIAGDLAVALDDVPRKPRDAVAVALATRYAQTLDDLFNALDGLFVCSRCASQYELPHVEESEAERARVVLEITRIGGRLEAMLDRLGMAPSARPAVPAAGEVAGGDPASAALDAARRDAAAGAPTSGLDYAAFVDPAVTGADAED